MQEDHKIAKDLEPLFISLARIVLTHMKQWDLSGQVPHDTHLKHEFYENDVWEKFETTENYTSLFRVTYIDFFLSMEETNLCARKHWEAGIFHYPHFLYGDNGIIFTSNTYEYEQVRGHIILQLLFVVDNIKKTYNTFRPSDAQIIKRYRYFRDIWMAPSICYKVTFPLLNFSSDLKQKSRIGSLLWLVPFSDEEKEDVWNTGAYRDSVIYNPLHPAVLADTKFSLTGFCFQGKQSNKRDTQEVVQELQNIITALRLSGEGAVGAPAFFEKGYICTWIASESFNRNLSIEDRLNDYSVSNLSFVLHQDYYLHEADLPTVEKLFNALQQLRIQPLASGLQKSHGELTVALRRFNQAYGRSLVEDHIVDLTMALESSLLAGKKEHAKKDKLSKRGAALLADTRDPGYIEALLVEMYEARNDIVHSGMLLSELGKHSTEFPRHCENCVRDILKEYVIRLASEKKQTLRNINAILDKPSVSIP